MFNFRPALALTALACALSVPLSAHAHRSWLLPSSTVLSGEKPWITVDAAVSNHIFEFEHNALLLEGVGQPLPIPEGAKQPPMRRPPSRIQITAPDGSSVNPENGHLGRFRSSFDVPLTQQGTYKLAIANQGVMASWKDAATQEPRRWTGPLAGLKEAIPNEANEVRVVETSSRIETFVTVGKPTDGTLKTTGNGLELAPITHPNDWIAGQPAPLAFLLNGQPAANVAITVIPDGSRFRNDSGEINAKTDEKGHVTLTLPTAGRYWLEAEFSSKEGLTPPLTERRATYSATLEIQVP